MPTWLITKNTFLSVTADSTKTLMILSPDHRARLLSESTDPDILLISNIFNPIDDALTLSYQNWSVANGLYNGATMAFENLLAELGHAKLEAWIPQIQVVFGESTPEFKSLFPKGKAAFNKGAYDIRLNAVGALGIALGSYAALAAVKTDVDNFYDTILAARTVQQKKEEDVRKMSKLLETARVTTCEEMYSNLGKLMSKFKKTPGDIERFFDLTLIQNPPKDKDTAAIILAGGDTGNLKSEGFTASTLIKIYNTGETKGVFFTSDSATGLCPEGQGLALAPNSNTELAVSALGGDPSNTFLNVTNLDPLNQGSFSVVIQ